MRKAQARMRKLGALFLIEHAAVRKPAIAAVPPHLPATKGATHMFHSNARCIGIKSLELAIRSSLLNRAGRIYGHLSLFPVA